MDEKKMDPPIQGQYYMHESAGIYHCRRCKQPLFSSADKFYSGSGYPSFDRSLPHAINVAGSLTRGEAIHCSQCDTFLGRLIRDEAFTDTQHRYDINSSVLQFRPGRTEI